MAQPLILARWKFFDASGLPLAGGKVYSYAAGTSTPQATYTDATGVTPNANPLILDANGQGDIWISSAAYKIILQDSLGNTLWTEDGIQTIPDGSITTVKLATGAVTTAIIADGAITTVKILDANVTTAKIADGAVTTSKIPDGAITFPKLSASTAIAFVDTSAPRYGDGARAFPVKPWTGPTALANPAAPLLGDGQCVRWSPNGKLLLVSENNSEGFAIYQRLGSELVRLSPATSLTFTSASRCGAWSPDAEYLTIGATGFNFLQRCGNAYAQIIAPLTATTGGINAIDWCPNGYYYATALTASPFVNIVKRTDVTKNHVVARYNSIAGQAIPTATTATVNFETQEEDNVAAVAIGAGWTFTCPRENTYRIQSYVGWATNTSAASTTALYTFKGSLRQISRGRETAASVPFPSVWGSITLSMVPTEPVRIAISHDAAGSINLSSSGDSVWVTITEDPGFNSLSTFAKLSDPATLPASSASAIKWSPDGQFLAVGHANNHYSFNVTAANATIGATYTNSGVTFTVSATISGATLLTTTASSPPAVSGMLTKTSGTGDGTITFSSVVPQVFVTIYQRTGDTFAKCADPAILPPGQVNGLAWSPDGLRLTCVHAISPFITTYTRPDTGSTTFTKVSVNPNVLPAGTGNGCAYNSLNTKLAVAHDSSPFLTIYTVAGSGSATTYTKDTDPGTLPTGNGKSVSWTPDSQYLSVGHVSSPYMTNYKTAGTYGSNAVTFVNEVDLV